MFVESERALEVLETELADVEFREAGMIRRVRGGVPRVHLMGTKRYHLELVVWEAGIGAVFLFYHALEGCGG